MGISLFFLSFSTVLTALFPAFQDPKLLQDLSFLCSLWMLISYPHVSPNTELSVLKISLKFWGSLPSAFTVSTEELMSLSRHSSHPTFLLPFSRCTVFSDNQSASHHVCRESLTLDHTMEQIWNGTTGSDPKVLQ